MRLLERYLSPFFASTLALSLLFAVMILLIARLTDVLDDLIAFRGPSSVTVRYLASQIPGFLHFSLPLVCFLSGTLLAARYRQSNEFVAIWSAGVSLTRCLRPVWLILFLLMLACFVMQETLLPQANYATRRAYQLISGSGQTTSETVSGVHLRDGNMTLFLSTVWPEQGRAEGILMRQRTPAGDVNTTCSRLVIVRKTARAQDCSTLTVSANMNTQADRIPSLTIANAKLLGALRAATRLSDEASITELQEQRTLLAMQGLADREPGVEIWQHILYPAVVVLATFAGLLSGLRYWRVGFALNFLSTLLFGIFYYTAMYTARSLGKVGALPAPIAAGLPNFLLAGGVLAYYRKNRF